MIHYVIFFILSTFIGVQPLEQAHEFHLSRAIVKHNAAEQAVQISLHLYIDDFEAALKARGVDSLFMCTTMESEETDKYIQLYLQDRFVLQAGEQLLVYEYLGKEISEDLQGVWMYLEVYNVESVTEMTIRNQLLTEVFDDQQNMMNVRANEKEHYLMLNKEESIKTLTWK